MSKIFFNFHKYSSVIYMFLQLGLPNFSDCSFCTVRHNAKWSFLKIRFITSLYAHVVIREWRYGPRWLRVDDDDDVCTVTRFCV